MAKTLSLRKSRKIMVAAYEWYRKKGKTLAPDRLQLFESYLQILDQALLTKDREQADLYAKKVEEFCGTHFKKSIFMHTQELVIALVFALAVAVVVRQMWFELYEIPSGSMRPTYQEKDHLTVSKTQFGLNIPLMPGHFYFDPELVKRTGVIIFLGDNLAIDDATAYFYDIVPYSKRFIKRLIAKPGDTVYFYGGKIYGVDKNDKPLTELLDSKWMQPLEHIPFLSFDGRGSFQNNQILMMQMNLPVGRITMTTGGLKGEIFNGKEWIADKPTTEKHDHIQTYSDLWGFRNYAMARLLTKEELTRNSDLPTKGLEEGVLYLELSHTPSLTSPPPSLNSLPHVILNPYKTIIPLQQQHLDALMDHIYTARFVVENGRARNYSVNSYSLGRREPAFANVADGTYQFDHGKLQQVGFGAILYDLPKDNPLYSKNPKNIQKLYNLGIEFNNLFAPTVANQNLFPNRYAYFRNGDLYLLDAPILKKDDPVLQSFNKREQERASVGSYIPFQDYGPPLDDKGNLDIAFIKAFGLKIPEKQYLVLGDNHAVSADSRVMGFIPEDNLQGVPDVLLWPPGNRWLQPEQTPYPMITLPRMVVWLIATIIGIISLAIWRRKRQKPIFKRLA